MRVRMKRRTMNTMTIVTSIMMTMKSITTRMSTMRKRNLRGDQTKNQRKRNTPQVRGGKATEDAMKSNRLKGTRKEFHSLCLWWWCRRIKLELKKNSLLPKILTRTGRRTSMRGYLTAFLTSRTTGRISLHCHTEEEFPRTGFRDQEALPPEMCMMFLGHLTEVLIPEIPTYL